jgi:hypothetical protein
MAAYGNEREQIQAFNIFDQCCFYGDGFNTYKFVIQDKIQNLGKGKFDVIGYQNQEHIIADSSMELILPQTIDLIDPVNKSTVINLQDNHLEWVNNGSSYVFLGTDNPPTNIFNGYLTENSTFILPTLNQGKTYYWYILDYLGKAISPINYFRAPKGMMNTQDTLVLQISFDNNVDDLSGKLNSGFAYNCIYGQDKFGEKDSAIIFNGFNSYVDITDDSTLNFGYGDFAVSFFARFPSQVGGNYNYGMIVGKNSQTFPFSGINILAESSVPGTISFRVDYNNFVTTNSYNLTDNNWRHYVFIRKSDTLKIFINGRIDNEMKVNPVNVLNGEILRIGANNIDEYAQNFEGSIDELQIFSKALSEKEIYSLIYKTPPKIIEKKFQDVYEDSTFSWSNWIIDKDTLFGDSIFFRMSLPHWLNCDPLNKIISGTPSGNDVGVNDIAIIAFDKLGNSDTLKTTLKVLHTNHSPVIVTQAGEQAVEDTPYRYQVRAIDQDSALFGDVVRYRFINKQSWLEIDSVSGVISGVPRIEHLSDTLVEIEAYDNNGGIALQRYTVHITHVNHIPEVVSLPIFGVKEDSVYRYQVIAEDPDTLVGDLFAYILTIRPSWLNVNSSGLVSGIPRGNNVGDTIITVRVSDGKGGIASQIYPIKVFHTNHVPVFVNLPDTMAVEDSLYTSRVWAQDQDSTLFGDVVRYRLVNAPSWLTPSGLNARDTVLTIQASDNFSLFTVHRSLLYVQHVNHVPVITSQPDTIAYEDSLYTYNFKIFDPDVAIFGDTLSIMSPNLSSWLKIIGDSIIVGRPSWNNVGDTVNTLVVNDGKGGEASQVWQLHIYNTNHAPILNTLLSPNDGDTVSLKSPPVPIKFQWNSAKDKDVIDTLRYSIIINGPGFDTTITGLQDTVVMLDIMNRLKEASWYKWLLHVSDGYVTITSHDTVQFRTSDKITSVFADNLNLPKEYALAQNYPNPFNPSTRIHYDLPKESRLRLTVYNLLGQVITILFDGIQRAGRYDIHWIPNSVSSGVYFVIMEAKDNTDAQKQYRAVIRMLLIR